MVHRTKSRVDVLTTDEYVLQHEPPLDRSPVDVGCVFYFFFHNGQPLGYVFWKKDSSPNPMRIAGRIPPKHGTGITKNDVFSSREEPCTGYCLSIRKLKIINSIVFASPSWEKLIEKMLTPLAVLLLFVGLPLGRGHALRNFYARPLRIKTWDQSYLQWRLHQLSD